MIKKIKKIKHFGVFANYQTDSKLPEFKKYNLIYGWNASGKTTLSRLLRCFELKTTHSDFPQAEFQLKTENGSIDHNGLDKLSNIRVFNQDFINENIFTKEDKVKPIYYIGEEDIKQKKQLEKLKTRGTNIKDTLDSEKEKLNQKEKEIEKLAKGNKRKIFNIH